MTLRFDNRYWFTDSRFGVEMAASPSSSPSPSLLAMNHKLADRLGLTAQERTSDAFINAIAGNGSLAGARPLALAYAGHQFGGFSPRLGDGRALLVGEVDDVMGEHLDLQLKGSGPTPFSRGGDGRCAIGPALRELVVSEAMAALGISTTEVVMVVGTGDVVRREEMHPRAVLLRVAKSHLRVGTFQYFATRGDVDGLRMLVDHAITRHFPAAADSEHLVLGFLDAVIDAQAALLASWMGVGFIHGVMNTDNCSIAGETLDYGPCAFMDGFVPMRVFSSIDRQGRYAYARQPTMAAWNIARLAETLVPLLADVADAEAVVSTFVDRFPAAYDAAHRATFARKLGLTLRVGDDDDDDGLLDALFAAMAESRLDFTTTFRALAAVAEAPTSSPDTVLPQPTPALVSWCGRYRARLLREPVSSSPAQRAASMRAVNPAIIPRNHVVEDALAAAEAGDFIPLEALRAALRDPFTETPSSLALASPPGEAQWQHRTFCGT